MPIIRYRIWQPSNRLTDKQRASGETLSPADKIVHAARIVRSYQAQGLRLTARQLYYQFVARGLHPNTEKTYKNFTKLITDARYGGYIDWEAIEDRGREPTVWAEYEGPRDLIDRSTNSYRLDRWAGQECYAELWVEKQALAGVLEPLAAEFHVTLMVNKGYSSASAMWESAQRFMRRSNQAESDFYNSDEPERRRILFYLGDHDPSGEDMVRDIAARLEEFGVTDLTVKKLALTMDQVREHDPPPNPAKLSDPRAGGYIAEHGNESWEVDALPPDILADIIRTAFQRIIDQRMMDNIKRIERQHIEQLRKAAAKIATE